MASSSGRPSCWKYAECGAALDERFEGRRRYSERRRLTLDLVLHEVADAAILDEWRGRALA